MLTRVHFKVIPGCGQQYGYNNFQDAFEGNFGLFQEIGKEVEWLGGGADREQHFYLEPSSFRITYLNQIVRDYSAAEMWFRRVCRRFFHGLQVESFSTTIRPALLARGEQASDDDASYYEGNFYLFEKVEVGAHNRVFGIKGFSNGDGVDVSLEIPHYRDAKIERVSQELALEAYLRALKSVDLNARLTMATRHLIMAHRQENRGYFNRSLKGLYQTIGDALPKSA